MKVMFSIVILTKNSMGVVNRLVEAILNQNFSQPYEVIFMDNNSTDETVHYLESVRFSKKSIIHVPEGQFSHSGTRMRAAAIAEGEFVIFFTDDIIPIGQDFLRHLTEPLLKNYADAAYGVCQIDSETSDPIDAFLNNSWPVSQPDFIEPISQFCWDHFNPDFRRRISNFDNCCSCINRELLLKLKFPDTPYGEDMLFAKRMILSGYKIALAREARFYHWHHVSFSYLLKRMCIDQYLSKTEFNTYYVRGKWHTVKSILIRILHRTYIAFFRLSIPFSKKMYWIFYNIKTLTADFIGKYIGTLENKPVRRDLLLINRKLMKIQQRIVGEINKKSIRRY
jgi:rhamnosyltransferase